MAVFNLAQGRSSSLMFVTAPRYFGEIKEIRK
jgi:hypothetical protein